MLLKTIVLSFLFAFTFCQDHQKISEDFNKIVEATKLTFSEVEKECKTAVCLKSKTLVGSINKYKVEYTELKLNAQLGFIFSLEYKLTQGIETVEGKFRFELVFKNVEMEGNDFSRSIKVYDELTYSFNLNSPGTYIALNKQLAKYKVTLPEFFNLIESEFFHVKDDVQKAFNASMEEYYKNKPVIQVVYDFLNTLAKVQVKFDKSDDVCNLVDSCGFENLALVNSRSNVFNVNNVSVDRFNGDLFVSFDAYLNYFSKKGEVSIKGNVRIDVNKNLLNLVNYQRLYL